MIDGSKARLLGLLLLACCPAPLSAQPCTREAARRVVDDTGARLRLLTAETQPKLQAKLRALKEKRRWSGAEGDEKAAQFLSDTRTAELDSAAANLLMRIDTLSEGDGSSEISCRTLADLEAASSELQATVRAKSLYVMDRLDKAIVGDLQSDAPPSTARPPSASPAANTDSAARPAGQAVSKSTPSPSQPGGKGAAAPGAKVTAATPAPKPARRADAAPTEPATPAAPRREPIVPKRPPTQAPTSGWTAETTTPPTTNWPSTQTSRAVPTEPSPHLPPDTGSRDGFSAGEIAQASQGFFGTISSGLGSVIEHAFSTLGRPTAYVLGTEGGGAFIAGVRYGQGQLFMHDGSKRKVYWHGPSIGYDIGAAGSKTMFLVYNLKRDIDIFTGYSGVDGSAYLVGGVGMTMLTNGKVVMAPIRSGLGVRLGASIGYVRFTARPTWNPF